MFSTRFLAPFLLSFIACGSVQQAAAKLVLAHSFAGDTVITREEDFLLLGRKAGGTPVYDVGFTIPADGTYLVTLSVICGVQSSDPKYSPSAGYIAVDVRIDGVSAVANTIFTLCDGDDDSLPLVGAIRQNVTIPVTMKKGRHDISVATELGRQAKSAILRHPAISIDD